MKLPLAGISGSVLTRVAACPPSAVLPQHGGENVFSRRGSAVHSFLENVGRYMQAGEALGQDVQEQRESAKKLALADVDEEFREVCENIEIDALPIGAFYEPEVQFAWDVTRGTARRCAYDEIDRTAEIGARADVLAISQDEAHDWRVGLVFDFKTGRRTTKAFSNWQLRILSMCAMRAHGLDRVDAMLLYLDPESGEVTSIDRCSFSMLDVDGFEIELRDVIVERVQKAAEVVLRGEEPRVYSGDHCRYCSAIAACPKWKAMLLRLATTQGQKELERELPTIELTPESAARAFKRIREIKMIIKIAEEALYAYASQVPVPLEDGMVLGLRQRLGKRKLDGHAVHAYLKRTFDEKLADAAVTYVATQASIKRVLQPYTKEAGQKFAPALRALMQALDDEGAISRSMGYTIDVHDPKKLPAPEGAES